MDSVSHACFSYLVCRSTGAAPAPRAGLLAGAVALLPDLDFLPEPFLSSVARFGFHRGPGHSLAVALLAGILIGGLVFRRLHLTWPRAMLIVALSWAAHIVLDICTGFGTALWWPATHTRVSADLLFIVDPLATLPLVAATLWDFRANRRTTVPRGRIALAGLLVWGGYALAALGIRMNITKDYRAELSRHGYQVMAIHAEPTPFNNQLWYLCAKTKNGFVLTYRSIWDGDQWERWTELPRNQHPLQTFAPHPLLDKIEVILEDWFTCRVLSPDRMDVVDMRLGKRYGWEDDDAPFLFVYEIERNEPGRLDWAMHKPGSYYDFGRLSVLFTRMGGTIPPGRLKPNPMHTENDAVAAIQQQPEPEKAP